MKKHSHPKASETKRELRAVPGEVPVDDTDVTAGKKSVLVKQLHPRCGNDPDSKETREELEEVQEC